MLLFWKILNRTLNLQRFTASVVAESNWDWCVKSKQHVLVISSESKENNIQTQIIFSRAVRSESNLIQNVINLTFLSRWDVMLLKLKV